MFGSILRLFRKLRFLLTRDPNADASEELRLHLEFLEEQYRAEGLPPDDAHSAARRQFGNLSSLTEQTRDLFSFRVIEDLRRDGRAGLRTLAKSKRFACIMISALALGLGANIMVFGFVNAMLLRPLDAAEPDRLVRAYSDGSDPRAFVDYRDYIAYRQRNRTLSDLAMTQWGGLYELRAEGLPVQVAHAMPVTSNYFATLGVRAVVGRTITVEDDRPSSPNVVVLSDACWERYYHRAPDLIGRTIHLNKTPFTVIGILPESFRGTDGSTLIPMHYIPWREDTDSGYLVGRLKQGVSIVEAQNDLSRVAAELSSGNETPTGIVVYPAGAANPILFRQFSIIGALFMLVAVIVLFIACSNVAILLLAKWTTRRREIAVRLALGASHSQLLRQLLAENLLLCAAGGIVGTALAVWAARMISRFSFPVPMPHGLIFRLDWRVIAFAVAMTLATTFLFGLAPALQSLRTDVLLSLKQGGVTNGRGSFRSRLALVAGQIAMCATLLGTTTVLVRGLNAPARNAGFDSASILMATVNLSHARYTPEESVVFYERMQHAFENRSHIVSAAIVNDIPLMPNAPLASTIARATSGEKMTVYTNEVSRGYFRTLNIPLLEGRDFNVRDDSEDKPVAIINETLARRISAGASAIGAHLQMADGSTLQVIGIARDARYESLDEEPKAFLYRPLPQQPAPSVTFLVKTRDNPILAAPELQTQVTEIDPDLVVYNVGTLEERIGLNVLPNRAAAIVGAILGALALMLSALGIYGAACFVAAERIREIAIRIALGAQPAMVMRVVTGEGAAFIAGGALLGLAAAAVLSALLRRFLYGIPPIDPAAFGGVALLLTGVAVLACYAPARTACRTNPASVLKA